MAKAKLEILGLTVPIGWFHTHHDDGFVDSIQKHIEALAEKYDRWGWPFVGKHVIGMYELYYTFFGAHHHIFYLDTSFEIVNISTRAHEETEFLRERGRLSYLADKILAEQNVRINFKEIKNPEVIAEIGSIYALLSRGISFKEHEKAQLELSSRLKLNDREKVVARNYTNYFKIAREIYEKGRLSQRKAA